MLRVNVLKGVPLFGYVQQRLFRSPHHLNNRYLQIGRTIRRLCDHHNIFDIWSFRTTVLQLSRGRSSCFSDYRLSIGAELISPFSNPKTASGMEIEALMATPPDISLETLTIDSSLALESGMSSFSKNLDFSSGNHLDTVEPVGMENDAAAELEGGVLPKWEKDTSTGFELNVGTETGDANIVIEVASFKTGDFESGIVVTTVTDEVSETHSGGTETKYSDSVLEAGIPDETLSNLNDVPVDDTKSKDSRKENASDLALTNRYAEKLLQFKAKLASNQTVLPSELLQKVSQLAAMRHAESGDAERLTVEYLEHPMVELMEGVQGPEDDWRKEMETIFVAYFNEADSEIPSSSSSKPSKERKSRDKMASARPKRVEPSHFIAIQITNSEIHEKLADVQRSVVMRKNILEKALVNLPTLHITLMVLYLKDNEQIERAKAALEVSKARVLDHGRDLGALPFSGIGDFNGKIVFAKVREGPELNRLQSIAETVRQSFAEQDLFSTDSKAFQAHLTIMKLSKCPQLFKKGIKKINSDFYAEQKDDYFGSQPIQSLQLCTMKKAENGYYPVDHEVFFDSEISNDNQEDNK